MSTNKKFRIQNGADIVGELSINDVTVIGADGKVVEGAVADAVASLTAADIADLQSQVSAILGTSPETLDTLQEIVTAFEGADSTLTGSVAQNASDIATINTTLTNGVATPTDVAGLQSQVTSNDTDIAANAAAIAAANARTAGVSTSSGSSNIQMAAEVDMDSNKVTNMADPSSAQDAATKAYVDAASTSSGSDLSSEESARIAADATLQANIDAEATTRSNLGSQLLGYINVNGSAITAGDAASVATAAADATAKADAAEASAKAHADAVGTAAVASVIDAAPASLDTLNELAAALGDDANFSATVTASIATKADDSATTAALATKADDAATTAALATKEDKTTVTALDAFIKGSSTSATYGVVNGDNIDPNWRNQDGHSWVGSNSGYGNGIDLTNATDSRAWISLPAGTHQFSYESIGPSGLGVSLFVIPESGDQNGDLVSQAIVKNENTLERSTQGTPPYWEYTVTEPVKLVVTNPVLNSNAMGNGHRTFTQMSVVVSTSLPSLETTSPTVVGAVNELHTELNALSSTQSGDQSNLQAQITAEVARASSAEAVNAANIVSETSARTSADAALESDIIGLQNQVGTIIAGSPASLDTLVEIVAAFEAADSSLSGVISANGGRLTTAENNITALETDLSAEESARGAGDAALQSQVTAHDGRLTTAEGEIDTLQAQMSARIGKDSDHDSDLSAETAARIAGDAANSAEVTAEASARSTADTALQSAIDSEASTRGSADTALQSAIDAEVSRATGVEAGLQSAIDFVKQNTDPAALDSLTEIVAAFQNADSSISGVVSSNTSRISSLESGQSAILAWDTDNVAEGTNNKYWTPERTKTALSGGLCITYNSVTGEIAIDEAETATDLHVATSGDANALGGQSPSHYRIDVYDVNGTVVN